MNDSVGIFSVYGCICRGRKKLSTDQGEGCGGGNGNESSISCRTNLVDPWLSSYTHHRDPLLPTCETHGDWWWGGKQVGENWKAHTPPALFWPLYLLWKEMFCKIFLENVWWDRFWTLMPLVNSGSHFSHGKSLNRLREWGMKSTHIYVRKTTSWLTSLVSQIL